MINEILEDTKAKLIAEKEQCIANEVNRNYQTVVVPYSASLDEKLNNAVNEIQIKTNNAIKQLQEDTQQNKMNFEKSEASKIKYSVEAKYVNALEMLDKIK